MTASVTPPANLAELWLRLISDMQVSRHEALSVYLFLPVSIPGEPGTVLRGRSSLEAVLTNVRGAVGRDETGAVVDPEQSRNWLGAIGYLTLVDQLSKLLDVPDLGKFAEPGQTEFERLLIWDGSLLSDEAAAIYALRCAFVHSYGLTNDSKATKAERRRMLRHVFELTADGREIVRLRNRVDAERHPLADLPSTSVDLMTPGDLVEGLVADLRRKHLAGTGLEMKKSLSLDAFRRACVFVHQEPEDWEGVTPA